MEEALGDRVRLEQYRHCFADDAAAAALAISQQENQTPALVEPLLVRQRCQKYHSDSGPINVDKAKYLEEIFGDETRESYA